MSSCTESPRRTQHQHAAALEHYVSQLAPSIAPPPGPGLQLTELTSVDLADVLADLYYALQRRLGSRDVSVELEFPWLLVGRETPHQRRLFRAQLVEMPGAEFNELARTALHLVRATSVADDVDAAGSAGSPAPFQISESYCASPESMSRDEGDEEESAFSPPLPVDLFLNAGGFPGGVEALDITSSVALDSPYGSEVVCCGNYFGDLVRVEMLPGVGATAHARGLLRVMHGWMDLKHPRLLPYHGVFRHASAEELRLGVVTPFVTQDVVSFLKDNHFADRLSILVDIAGAAAYLHDSHLPLVHGGISPINVMVQSGVPYLRNYGLNPFLARMGVDTLETCPLNLRYSAPELFDKHAMHTPASDVFALAMLGTEVYTLLPPFHSLHRPAEVISAILRGERPHVSHDCPAALAALIDECLHPTPALRPSMREVHDRLARMLAARNAAACYCAGSAKYSSVSSPPPTPELNELRLRGVPQNP
ncbi:kinase-like protein [Auricularia subglabra TFB-10046 SS5]|nr:kinase-like protein [Auricularia subglabra TFB-10046 SS5]